MEAPRPAAGASVDDLLELFQSIRKELEQREEAPSGAWVDSSVAETRSGAKPAWYYPPADGGGIAFYSRRGPKVWGHVHAAAAPAAPERARRLAEAMLDALPADVGWVSVGFSGFDVASEREVARGLAERPGGFAVERYQMEAVLRPGPIRPAPSVPEGVELLPARAATTAAIADLDARAFRGSVDDLVMGGSVEEYTEMVERLLASGLGRFLDEASIVLYEPDPPRLVGGILDAEVSPRRGVVLDLMVDPARRGRGWGRFLLRWGLRAFQALGYSTATLWVTESNVAARRLYESEGFARTASTVLFHWTRPDGVPQPQTSR
jgi:mycothiol synthase